MKKFLSLSLAAVAVTAMAAPQAVPAKHSQMTNESRFSVSQVATPAQKGVKFDAKGASKIATKADDVTPFYLMPKDAFRSAFFAHDGSFSSYAATLVAPAVPVTFRNMSNGGGQNDFDWLFYNANLDEQYLSEVQSYDLTQTFPRDCSGFWISPRLYYGASEDYYAMTGGVQYGGSVEMDADGDGSIMTTVSNYDPRADYNGLMTIPGAMAGKTAAEASGNFYEEMLEETEAAATYAEIVAFYHHFSAPARPYAFSKVNFLALVNGKAGQTLTAKVCGVNAQGYIENDKPIATAEFVLENDMNGDLESIDFYFEKEDPTTGLTEENWLNINREIFIIIDGVSELELIKPVLVGMDRNFYLDHRAAFEQNGYSEWLYYDAAGKPVDDVIYACHAGYFWGSGDNSSLPSTALISINAQYDYIALDDAQEKEVEFAKAGESIELEVEASDVFDMWNPAGEEEGLLPEWLSFEGVDEFAADEDGEYFAGKVKLTLTADALPEGVAGRETTVFFTLKTQTIAIKVKQGENAPSLKGDVDGNGVVDIADVNIIINIVLGSDDAAKYDGRADVTGDGVVDIADANEAINIMLK